MGTEEKDRLGDKLKDAERGREDQFFAERDRQLLAKLRGANAESAEADREEAPPMRCPKCATHLQQRTLNGVQVEQCPSCRGMWLDHGEQEKIGRRETDGWIARWLRTEFPESA